MRLFPQGGIAMRSTTARRRLLVDPSFQLRLVFLMAGYLLLWTKFSHRIAGPLFRCRQVMREMTEGKTVAEFKPRKHDLLDDFVRDFNSLIREWNTRSERKQVSDPCHRDGIEASEEGDSADANDRLAAPTGCATD
jgi:hypothetical protein